MKTIRFQNPANQHIETIQNPAFGAVLLGPLSIGLAGAWGPAVGYFVLTLFSAGGFWVILPFLAEGIIRKHYLGRGWIELPALQKEKAENYQAQTAMDDYFAPVMAGITICSVMILTAMAVFAWAL